MTRPRQARLLPELVLVLVPVPEPELVPELEPEPELVPVLELVLEPETLHSL